MRAKVIVCRREGGATCISGRLRFLRSQPAVTGAFTRRRTVRRIGSDRVVVRRDVAPADVSASAVLALVVAVACVRFYTCVDHQGLMLDFAGQRNRQGRSRSVLWRWKVRQKAQTEA